MTYTVTIHRKNGSVKRKTCKSEPDAYAWARMACNSAWDEAYIAPDDQSHAAKRIYSAACTPAENTRTMQTPHFAKGASQ